MYLGATVYRIHGTNQPQTIGSAVSSGCFRLVNGDVIDLYERVNVGTKVIVRQTCRRSEYGHKGLHVQRMKLAGRLRAAAPSPASAQATLKAVKDRGELICGVNQGLPGFRRAERQGRVDRLDVDFCRAIAAAARRSEEGEIRAAVGRGAVRRAEEGRSRPPVAIRPGPMSREAGQG